MRNVPHNLGPLNTCYGIAALCGDACGVQSCWASASADGPLGGKACFLPCGPRWELSAFRSCRHACAWLYASMCDEFLSLWNHKPKPFFFLKRKLFAPWYSIAAKRRNERGQHPNGQVAQGFRADPSLSLKYGLI